MKNKNEAENNLKDNVDRLAEYTKDIFSIQAKINDASGDIITEVVGLMKKNKKHQSNINIIILTLIIVMDIALIVQLFIK